MTKTGWLIFGAICLGLLGVLIYTSQSDKIDVSNVDVTAIRESTDEIIGDNTYGNKDAKVTIVEYGDFQCPGCGQVHPTVEQIKEEYKDKVHFVFRNFPLTQAHPNARAAASAAEAAGLQGKYWEMYDRIYSAQSTWENLSGDQRTDQFANWADELGLNRDQFLSDMTSGKVSHKINYDLALGKKQNVTATPFFFINGQKVDQGTWGDKAKFTQAIDDALKANS